MRVLEAAMQAVVAHAIAVAIARLLVEHIGNLGCEFISVGLIWILGVGSPKTSLAQDSRQLGALRRRRRIIGRDSSLFLG
jgi:hypothetical protein